MYKVLVVDDEKWIRKGIIAKMARYGLHFSAVLEAASADEALATIRRERPDIALVDVLMEGMNGIELIRETRVFNKRIKFIVITGHSEFEYAERAINYGARGFILKPIEASLFVKRMQSVMLELDQEAASASHLMVRRPAADGPAGGVAGSEYAGSTIRQFPSVSDFMDARDWQFFPGRASVSSLGIVHVDNNGYQSWTYQSRLLSSARERIERSLSRLFREPVVGLSRDPGYPGNLIFVSRNTDPTCSARIATRCAGLALAVAQKTGDSVTVGMSETCSRELEYLFNQAHQALSSRLLLGTGKLYRFRPDCEMPRIEDYSLRRIEEHIKNNQAPELKDHLRRLLSPKGKAVLPSAYLRYAYFSVLHVLIATMSEQTERISDLTPMMLGERVFDYFDTTDQLVEALCREVSKVLSMGKQSSTPVNEGKAEQVRRYIDRHFSEQISTKALAAEFFVNANYLSTLFRRQVGVTISSYITQVRLNSACRLLQETSLSVAAVAEMVGFTDAKYFHKVFRETKGMTPGVFRETA